MDISTARLLLDVEADATKNDINEAFREKVISEHPDQSDSEDADERTKRLQEAKDVLLSTHCDETSTVDTTTTSTDSKQSQSSTGEQETRTNDTSQSQSRAQATSNSTGSYSRKQQNTESDQTSSDNSTGERTRSSTTSTERQSSKSEPDGGNSTSSGENLSQTRRMFQTGMFSSSISPNVIVGILSLAYIGVFSTMVAVQGDTQVLGLLSVIWMIISVLLGVSLRYDDIDRFGEWNEGLIAAIWPLVALVGMTGAGLVESLFKTLLGHDGGLIGLLAVYAIFIYFPALVGLISVLRQIFNPL